MTQKGYVGKQYLHGQILCRSKIFIFIMPVNFLKKQKVFPKREHFLIFVLYSAYLLLFIAACAAASLAMGTRKGEQET